MARHDDAVRRLTGLAIALLDADRRGGRLLTPSWIRTHLEGYRDQSDGSFHTKLSRDMATLARAGVPIEVHSTGEGGSAYRLKAGHYELPEVSFTPEEATVLGLAGEIGRNSEMGAFARSGWTKIAAAGASRDLTQAPVFETVDDMHRLEPKVFGDIQTIIRAGLRMSFDYLATPTSEPVRRVMDPWGLVPLQGRMYLVGHDIERDEPRSFRIHRVRNVRRLRTALTHESPGDLQRIVEDSLRVRRRRVDAVLTIPEGRALELRQAGEERADGRFLLSDVDRDWLARTAAGFAPDVIVHEPADVRADIRALLEGVRP